jgi:hypothetical protein
LLGYKNSNITTRHYSPRGDARGGCSRMSQRTLAK